MRLTLRTLLNWINNNLSEEDAVLVAHKVEESELAKTIQFQIEGVLKLPTLPALTVLDGTPLGNANSTAEYLDNAMNPQKTPDYEKFCIHSEIILGEVASCHRILSHVLNNEQEIAPELQTRLCELFKFTNVGDEYSIPITQPIQPETIPPEAIFDEIPEEAPTMALPPQETVSQQPAKDAQVTSTSQIVTPTKAVPQKKTAVVASPISAQPKNSTKPAVSATPNAVAETRPVTVPQIRSEIPSQEEPAGLPTNYWMWSTLLLLSADILYILLRLLGILP